VNVLDMLAFEAGAFYVKDRGYLDFTRLHRLHQSGAFFVTRARLGMNARSVYSNPVDRSTGLICDQLVMLTGHYPVRNYPEHLRRIKFKDLESGKTLVFLTNNTGLPALTICALYKSRWQVEMFFKWIKQHLRIKHLLGNSENAVKTQVWCAMATWCSSPSSGRNFNLRSRCTHVYRSCRSPYSRKPSFHAPSRPMSPQLA